MKYPNNWSYQELSDSKTTAVSITEIVPPLEDDSEVLTSVSLVFKSHDHKMTLDHYARNTIRSYKVTHNSNFTLIYAGKDFLNRQPGYRVTLCYVEQNYVMVCLETGAIFNNKLYHTSFVTQLSKFAQFLPIVLRMIHSFEIFP